MGRLDCAEGLQEFWIDTWSPNAEAIRLELLLFGWWSPNAEMTWSRFSLVGGWYMQRWMEHVYLFQCRCEYYHSSMVDGFAVVDGAHFYDWTRLEGSGVCVVWLLCQLLVVTCLGDMEYVSPRSSHGEMMEWS